MKLFLDDVRDPEKYHIMGWVWVKTAEDAVRLLRTGEVTEAALDHDLTDEQMIRGGYFGEIYEDGHKSGYDVVEFLEQHPQFWPPDGVSVHSRNPAGKKRMHQVIYNHYRKLFLPLF